MAYEFPGYKGNCCDDSEALRAVLAVLEKYEALEARVESLEDTTSQYPAQWANAIANSERVTRQMITQHDEQIRSEIASSLTQANAFTTQQIALLKNILESDIQANTLKITALADQYAQLAGDYHSNKIRVDGEIESIKEQINAIGGEYGDLQKLISQETAVREAADDALRRAIEVLEDKMIDQVNLLVNPISGDTQSIQAVVNAIYESLRTITTMQVRQIEASNITAGDVKRALMTGGEISGGGILLKHRTAINPVTGFERSEANIRSFIPYTRGEWPGQNLDAQYGQPKERDIDNEDWRYNGKIFENMGWKLLSEYPTMFEVRYDTEIEYTSSTTGRFDVPCKFEPDRVRAFITLTNGHKIGKWLDWSWHDGTISVDFGVHYDYSKIELSIVSYVERSDFNGTE